VHRLADMPGSSGGAVKDERAYGLRMGADALLHRGAASSGKQRLSQAMVPRVGTFRWPRAMHASEARAMVMDIIGWTKHSSSHHRNDR
jgi:hypothetical protein